MKSHYKWDVSIIISKNVYPTNIQTEVWLLVGYQFLVYFGLGRKKTTCISRGLKTEFYSKASIPGTKAT